MSCKSIVGAHTLPNNSLSTSVTILALLRLVGNRMQLQKSQKGKKLFVDLLHFRTFAEHSKKNFKSMFVQLRAAPSIPRPSLRPSIQGHNLSVVLYLVELESLGQEPNCLSSIRAS
jgi:hypothetical protein